MKRIIYYNQVKLIPELQGWLNMQKLIIRIIHHSNRQKRKKYIIIFIDAGKAFNKIQSIKKVAAN